MQPIKNDDSDDSDKRSKRAGFDGGGGGGYDGTMNERITRLETFAAEVVRRLDKLEHLVEELGCKIAEYRLETKRDIDQAIKWIVGVMLAISMAAITIITFVLNYATPKAVPAAQPIIIYAMPAPAVPGARVQ